MRKEAWEMKYMIIIASYHTETMKQNFFNLHPSLDQSAHSECHSDWLMAMVFGKHVSLQCVRLMIADLWRLQLIMLL